MARRKVIISTSYFDIGILLLRVGLGISLFVKHGIDKITHFSQMQGHFPNPIHVGKTTGLIFALLSDSICSLLVAIGLGTRIAAGIIFINLLVVFIFMHQFSFSQDHAELVYVYLFAYLCITLSGGGKYAVDARFK